MFASHLWVRAAAVMSGGAEEPSPVKAFLSPLNLLEYRDLLKEPGADVPGVDSPGSGLTRPPAGPGSARGRDSLGLRVAPARHSLWVPQRVPDPPHPGFRISHMAARCPRVGLVYLPPPPNRFLLA